MKRRRQHHNRAAHPNLHNRIQALETIQRINDLLFSFGCTAATTAELGDAPISKLHGTRTPKIQISAEIPHGSQESLIM